MKTVADIKRKMIKGTFWKATHHASGKDVDLGIRPVSKVQTNSFAFKKTHADGKTTSDSWCDWPKKSEVTFYPENENKFSISHDGLMYLTYELVEGTINEE